MTALYFVDTNVFVYRRDSRDAGKQAAAQNWLAFLWQSRTGRVSMQVLHEYYQVLTRRLKPAVSHADASTEVEKLFVWDPVVMTPDVLRLAWTVEKRFQLSFWDSLILAAAKTSGCQFVLTEDLQDGQNVDGVTAINPFTHDVPPLNRAHSGELAPG